jgi:hypothetical protein
VKIAIFWEINKNCFHLDKRFTRNKKLNISIIIFEHTKKTDNRYKSSMVTVSLLMVYL